jgi:MYXO-CTERM domain-containing protein
MALDKLTFLEVHLDGAQIGPKFGSTADEEMTEAEMAPESDIETSEESSGSGRGRAILGGVLALALFGVVAWRRRKGRQTTMDDYTEREGGLSDSDTVELDDIDA